MMSVFSRLPGNKGPFKGLSCYQNHGFTLVELMVVLLLMGLLTSLVALSVSSGIFKSQENRFVQDFMAGLKQARNMAIGRGRAVNFLIDSENRTFGPEGTAPRQIPKTIEITGSGVVELGPGVYSITFYPDGSASGGEVDLNWDNGRKDAFKVGTVWARIVHGISTS